MADQYTPLPVKTKTDGDIVANIHNGTVTSVTNVDAGTITSVESGTVTALAVGTIGGKAASGAAAVNNPVLLGGTDSGGTVYAPLVSAAGAVSVTGASAGTNVNIVTGTQETLGTVGVVNNLVKGTITKVEGGTVGEVTSVSSVANIVKGTVTSVEGLPDPLGSVVVTTGTIGDLNTIGTVGVVEGGTIGEVTSITNGTIFVSNFPGASSPKFSYLTSSALAAGASGTLNTSAITNSTTGQLAKVVVSSSVPVRAEVNKLNVGTIPPNGTAGVIFTSAAFPTADLTPPTDTYFTQAGNGTDTFQVIIKNMDNSLAADVYTTVFWDEV